MDILPSSSFDTNDKNAWAAWNLDHIAAHNTIFEEALKAGYMVSQYPLDYEKDAWKENHQTVHASLYNQLGLDDGVPDLMDVDFNNQEEFDDWMLYHAQIHQQINEALGL
jgi:hypothetical protein